MAVIAVDLPEQVLAELSDAAAADGRSIEATVISALQVFLAARRERQPWQPRSWEPPDNTLEPSEPPD